ncbi:putative ribonuclease H-like domain-containing protein [Tanacetum coccineum]
MLQAQSLDSIVNRLQKLVSRLAILSVVITTEDLNSKFLRSLPLEWNTHVVVWMNKTDIETMSIDDLYNNFKIVEQKVKKSIGANTGTQNLAFMTASSTSSTNNVNTANSEVSTVSTNINTAGTENSTANLNDATVYAFLSNQPKGSQLVHEDLEQIHDIDLEEMDLKWQLALLSVRARKFYQRTGKKIIINGSDTARYDKSKVECFNCHKMGYFARECRALRNKDVNVEDTSSKAMLAIDGIGFDWSDMAEEQKQCDELIVKLNDIEFKAATYKRGLATVEDQLVTFRKNEVLFGEEIVVLKREVGCKDYEFGELKAEYEKVKQEKEGIDFKIAKYDNSLKDLDKLLASQITDKSKKGLGYHVVAPPHPLSLNAPTKLDLTYSGLDEFKEPEFNGYGPKDTVLKSTNDCDKESANSKENTDDSLEKEQVSDNESSSIESPLKHELILSGQMGSMLLSPQHVGFGDLPDLMVHYLFSTDITTLMHEADPRFVDNGCSRHMTGNIAYLSNFKEFDGGHVTFGGGAYGGRISSKGTLKTNSLDFDDVYFVKELNFNLFSVSQMCDKRNYVLFTDTECLVVSPNFKLPDESQILLKIPREDNMYSFDIKNIVPKESLTCLVAKATLDESMLWHRRLGHINFKNINKLVKENLVRGLLGFSILKNFIKEIENLVENKVKIIRCDNGTEFKNKVMDDFFKEKGIKREYSVARTPQQNGVAERRNRTLIEAARTMLANSKLPITFWAEAVSTACYVQNRVLIVKPQNKTHCELFRGFKPALSFMKPFGCHVTILNTLDHLGKFDGKSDEGFFVGYSLSSKAFRVYNTRTRKVEENLHVGFLENKPMIEGNGPKWLFDIDSLTQSMNYVPVVAGTMSNESAGIQGNLNVGTSTQKEQVSQECIMMPIWKNASYFDSPSKDVGNDEPKSATNDPKQVKNGPSNESDDKDKSEDDSSPKEENTVEAQVNTASLGVNTSSFELNNVDSPVNTTASKDKSGASPTSKATHLEYFKDEDELEVDLRNILSSYTVPTNPNIRIHKDHSIKNVIGDVKSSVQTRRIQIEEEVYVCQPPRFEDPDYPDKVYKVVKALYGLHQAPTAWYETLANYLLGNGFQRGNIDLTLFIKRQKGEILLVQQKKDGIFISQDKYVDKILKKFNYTDVKSASTLFDLEKPLVKDGDATNVVVHLYRSMIGSLMYLTTSRPDIMFAVCACARFQVTPKTSHLTAVKRIFKYLKGKPTLGLWYSRDSPFKLVAYTDSDYAGATQDRKSTTGGS